MSNATKLTTQINRVFLTSFVAVAMISLLMILVFSRSLEDMAIERQFKILVNTYARNEDSLSESPVFSQLKFFTDKTEIPKTFASLMDDWRPGFYELEHASLEYHYAIVPLESGKTLYVFYNIAALELPEDQEFVFEIVLLALYSGLFIIGFLLLRKALNKGLKPLHRLTEQLTNALSQPDKSISLDLSHYQDDEIGLLARTIQNLSINVEDHIKRERDFSSYVSHELRTPLSVIKGAAEVLMLNQDSFNDGPLARIARAANDMNSMVNVFLSLARADEHETMAVTGVLSEIVLCAVEDVRFAYGRSNEDMSLEIDTGEMIEVEKSYADIVTKNLLHNAIAHASSRVIRVTLQGAVLTITNDCKGFKASSYEGYGLGLKIVERICQRKGWRFDIQLGETYVTARVVFGGACPLARERSDLSVHAYNF